MIKTHGIHHISSIVGHAQRNIDFYAGVLGYRLVKQTLNYDDSETYHLYYGNKDASTGLVTTFPWNDAQEGELGGGQVSVASYGIRPENFEFWKERLNKFGISNFEYTKFNKKRLGFKDMDGLQLELIETQAGPKNPWEFNGVDSDHAIIGIENATLSSTNPEKTLEVLTNFLGYTLMDQDEETYLLHIHDGLGGILELSKQPDSYGSMGVGVVHHIALAIKDDEIDAWLEKLKEGGFNSSGIKNRKYFRSLYFREPGGILIELATEGPGMGVDEDIEHLGETLMIPAHFTENDYSNIMPIFVREVDELIGYGYRDRFEYEHLEKRNAIRQQISELKKKETLTNEELNELENLRKQYTNKGEN